MSDIVFHKKDKDPADTIKLIKSILRQLKIDVVENICDPSDVGSYSLRLTIKGTSIGVNGKGTTKELALASAYGEFIERLENGILTDIESEQKYLIKNANKLYSSDEKILSAENIITSNSVFIKKFLEANLQEKNTITKQSNWFNNLCSNKYSKFKRKDEYICVPYENYISKEYEYLPVFLTRCLLGSNGMSAGNTKEEALVEGISELIERKVQEDVIAKALSLPNIPDSVICKYKSVYKMYSEAKKLDEYTVKLKDASLGGIWPVAALLIINNNTGKFGVNFGSHPNIAIAMERVFTEAFQNRKIDVFSQNTTINFNNKICCSYKSVINNSIDGSGNYPVSILCDISNFKFNFPICDKNTNKEYLKYLIDLLHKNDCTILIRDKSYFDFPAYQTIIPQFISSNTYNQNNIINSNNNDQVKELLLDVRNISKKNAKILIKHFNNNLWHSQFRHLQCYIPECTDKIPICCGKSKYGTYYLLSMLYVLCNDYNNAYNTFKVISNKLSDENFCDKKNKSRILIIEIYLDARRNNYSHEKALQILNYCFSKDNCNFINTLFKDNNKILVKQYPILNEVFNEEYFYPKKIVEEINKKLFEKM